MGDQLIDRENDQAAFEAYFANVRLMHFDAAWKAWQAARDHYAPKLSESDAAKILYLNFDGDRMGQAKATIMKLAAAGVRFKEQRVEGSGQ